MSDADPTIADLGEAQLDLQRASRCGFPEVVYAEGKTVEVLGRIFRRLLEDGIEVLATRVSAEQHAALQADFPTMRYNTAAHVVRVPLGAPSAADAPCVAEQSRSRSGAASQSHRASQGHSASQNRAVPQGRVVVLTAGTSDLPVAEEARETLEWMGQQVTMIHDVGVAGPQRLLAQVPRIVGADAVVVVAGMEGALPSVVAGHVDCPVVAVPTSVGYGASLGGVAALLSMLNSCAANVAVVNIDSGFKGGYVAGLIARNAARGRM